MQFFDQQKVMFGMVGDNAESLKFIGASDINMAANMKTTFAAINEYHYYPYFNDAKELF